MSSEMFTHLLLPLCEDHHIRCIASDRRGFGKSAFTGSRPIEGGPTYDTFAADTIELIAASKVDDFVFVAASMGCGESLLAYHQSDHAMKKRCKGFVWLGPSLPYPLKTDDNPGAPSQELWDSIVAAVRADSVGFARVGLQGVFGTNIDIGIEVNATVMERFEWIVQQADALAVERCIGIITSKDFTRDLRALQDRKVLILHGDHDQGTHDLDWLCCGCTDESGMPAEASAHLIPQYVKHAKVKVYENAAHGLYLTHAKEVISDVLGFVADL